jgi:hypothetical protein
MKKIILLLAAALMVVGLTGCMDDVDGTNQRMKNSYSNQL